MSSNKPVVSKDVKPGFKSTEFWLTMASNVAAILITVSEAVEPKVGAVLAIVANGLYAISRGFAKK